MIAVYATEKRYMQLFQLCVKEINFKHGILRLAAIL